MIGVETRDWSVPLGRPRISLAADSPCLVNISMCLWHTPLLRVLLPCCGDRTPRLPRLTQPLEALHFEDDIQLVFFHPQYAFR